jgi:hypothetical protein
MWSSNHELKTYAHTKIWTQMFIIALFVIAPNWKALRCPSVGEWINELWSIQTIDYYSLINRTELPSHEKTWRILKCTLLSERRQSGRLHTYCMIPTMGHSGKDKTKKEGVREEEQRSPRQEVLLCHIVMHKSHHYTSVKTHRMGGGTRL